MRMKSEVNEGEGEGEGSAGCEILNRIRSRGWNEEAVMKSKVLKAYFFHNQ